MAFHLQWSVLYPFTRLSGEKKCCTSVLFWFSSWLVQVMVGACYMRVQREMSESGKNFFLFTSKLYLFKSSFLMYLMNRIRNWILIRTWNCELFWGVFRLDAILVTLKHYLIAWSCRAMHCRSFLLLPPPLHHIRFAS